MRKLLMIIDPIPSGQSVQYELFRSIAASLRKTFEVTLASVYFSGKRMELFSQQGLHPITPPRRRLYLDWMLNIFGKGNESMLWLESWIREGMFSRNSRDFKCILSGNDFDYVINATNTVPVNSDLWWAQGPPLHITLNDMSDHNVLARLASRLGKPAIKRIDSKLTQEMTKRCRLIVANSKYSERVYESMGLDVSAVVFNTKDLSPFIPSTTGPRRDFVLTYIGKETDFGPILALASNGVKIVAFGSKLPIGMNVGSLSRNVDFRGRVTHEELIDLYSNAMFTLFPFTNEPFGYIPLESMACGTPVLTYDKQGPSETVIDKQTGWLVDSSEDMVRKGRELWANHVGEDMSRNCIRRAGEFDSSRSAQQLTELLVRNTTS